MSNIIQLDKFRKSQRQDKAKAATLCGTGFHKWKIVTSSKFDVKQGKLVTLERCERCNAERTILK